MFKTTDLPLFVWFPLLVFFGILNSANASVILDQDFDSEDTGLVPLGWSVSNPAFGSLTVDANE